MAGAVFFADFFHMMAGHELWNVLILVRIGMYVTRLNPEAFRIIVMLGDLLNIRTSKETINPADPHVEIWYRVGVVCSDF